MRAAFARGEFKYIGGSDYENVFSHMLEGTDTKLRYPAEGPLVRQNREFFTLDHGVYDLRATLVYLALQQPKRHGYPIASQNQDRAAGYYWIDQAFRNAFTRAARSLVGQGFLINIDDGKGPQLRFVSRADDDDDD